MSVYSRKLKRNYYKYNCHYLLTDRITNGLFDGYMSNSPPDKKKSPIE